MPTDAASGSTTGRGNTGSMIDCTVPRGLRLIRFSQVMFSLTPIGRLLKTPSLPSRTRITARLGVTGSPCTSCPPRELKSPLPHGPQERWTTNGRSGPNLEKRKTALRRGHGRRRPAQEKARETHGKPPENRRKNRGKNLQKKLGKNKKPPKRTFPATRHRSLTSGNEKGLHLMEAPGQSRPVSSHLFFIAFMVFIRARNQYTSARLRKRRVSL